MDAPLPLAGRYRYLRGLRGASSGLIWLASDSVAGRTVVVSSVTPIRVAGLKNGLGLTHLHLATLLDLFDDISPGQIPGRVALRPGMAIAVAEHIAGQTLHERLESTPLSLHRAVGVVANIANALQALHAKGSVHGALSPRSMVVLRNDGGVVPVLTNLRAAANGAYCSPERVRGGGPSTDDDVWALYSTLFAAMTGDAPFEGKTREELAASILSGTVPNLVVHGVDDPDLQEIIRLGFHPDRNARQTSAAVLENVLTAWLREHPSEHQERVSISAPFTSLPPPPIDDEDVAEGHRTLAVASIFSSGNNASSSNADNDDDDDQATILLDAKANVAAAIATFGSPLGHPDDDATLQDQLPTNVMSTPELGAMLERIEAESARAPMPSVTRSMDPQVIDSFRAMSREQSDPQGADENSNLNAALPPPAAIAPPLDPVAPPSDAIAMDDQVLAAAPAFPVSGPQKGWGPSEPTPPVIDPESLPLATEPLVPEQDWIDPAAVRASLSDPEPTSKKSSALRWVFGGLLLMVIAATLSFILAVVVSGGTLPAPISSLPRVFRSLFHPADDTSHAATNPASNEIPPAPASSSSAPEQASASASAEMMASASAPPTALSEEQLNACAQDFFPPNTFIRTVSFDFLCANDNPRKSAVMLHQQIIHAGAGSVTDGMRLWSSLSWYELVVVTMIRNACCPGAAPLVLPEPGEPCASMVDVLQDASRGPCTQPHLGQRISRFEESVRCLYAHDRPRPYRYQGLLNSHQRATFEEFAGRIPPARCAPP